ncbi:MAG: type VI secretion system-associated protein TagF [Gammaproteobacteria bacterium]|nr:MAG: type VI secretion system-associated protein TagF [Gammaproteobacteria bacterium]
MPRNAVDQQQAPLGLYGKLPAHGDFVTRRLSQEFIQGWDDWLQRAIASSQEQLGNQWLDIYLTSPLWRFVLSPGIVDNQCWAGVLMPSIDSVGRYFPLTLARPVLQLASPAEMIAQGEAWFAGLEEIALSGLQEGVNADALDQALTAYDDVQLSGTSAVGVALEFSRPVMVPLEQNAPNPLLSFPFLLDSFLQQRLPSYSLWWSTGSERVAPNFSVSGHLPPPQSFAAMLDGQWQNWNWSTPFSVMPYDNGELLMPAETESPKEGV